MPVSFCGNVVLRRVGLEHDLRCPCARTCAPAASSRPREPRQQIEQRPLAVIERDVVEVVEHARIAQRAQLRVHPAAAEDQLRVRRRGADRARHAEGAVDVAGEGRRDGDDVGLLRGEQFARELVERLDRRASARPSAPRAADRKSRSSRRASRRSARARSADRCRAARRRRDRRRTGSRDSAPAPSCPSAPNAAWICSSSACSKRGPSGRNARPTMRNARLGSRRCRKRIAGSTVSA